MEMEIVISLLLFLGEPPTLKEHLYIQDQKMHTCLKMKRIAERSSNAKYQCARVKENIVIDEYSGEKKITSITSLD
jgi:hypothetical protein